MNQLQLTRILISKNDERVRLYNFVTLQRYYYHNLYLNRLLILNIAVTFLETLSLQFFVNLQPLFFLTFITL